MRRIKVLIADDHHLFVDGLCRLLEGDYDVVGRVEDGRALLQAVQDKRPDLVLLDISMPLLNGLDATEQLIKVHPGLKVIVITMHARKDFVSRAFDVGASGYVLKHSASEELQRAMREVLAGRVYISPLVAKDLLDSYQSVAKGRQDGIVSLTPRQREVLQLIAEGKTAKEVAATLHISTRTVEFHKYKMMRQLGLETTADLIQYAVKNGVVSG